MYMKKRGQEGFSFTAILGLIVGLVALVMVALFIYKSMSKATDTVELLPGEEAMASQVCGVTATMGDSTLICDEFNEIKIGGKDRLVNCKYVATLFSETPEWGNKLTLECTDAEKKYCSKLSEEELGKKGVLINNGICAGSETVIPLENNLKGTGKINCWYEKVEGEGYYRNNIDPNCNVNTPNQTL